MDFLQLGSRFAVADSLRALEQIGLGALYYTPNTGLLSWKA